MAITKKDLYKIFMNRSLAYAVFLAKEETDTTLLPEPMTKEEKELYDFCVSFASDVAERATDISAAKNWATKTDGAVADGEYSAKHYALLAKDWAVKMDGKVNDEDYSAKYYADQAHPEETAGET